MEIEITFVYDPQISFLPAPGIEPTTGSLCENHCKYYYIYLLYSVNIIFTIKLAYKKIYIISTLHANIPVFIYFMLDT